MALSKLTVNMADTDLISRRESRRRRILDNSETRLKKIFSQKEALRGLSPDLKSDIHVAEVSHAPKSNGSSSAYPFHDGPRIRFPTTTNDDTPDAVNAAVEQDQVNKRPLPSMNIFQSSLTDLLTEDSSPVISQDTIQAETESKSYLFNTQNVKLLRVVCLALSVKLALMLDYGFLFAQLPLLPFLLLELAEIWPIEAGSSSGSSGILGTVLLLSGIVPRKAAFITTVFGIVSHIVQYLSIYLFTFVMVHVILEWPG